MSKKNKSPVVKGHPKPAPPAKTKPKVSQPPLSLSKTTERHNVDHDFSSSSQAEKLKSPFLSSWSHWETKAQKFFPVSIALGIAIIAGILVFLFSLLINSNHNASSVPQPSTQSTFATSSSSNSISAPLLMPLSTRSGPSVIYDEPGGFFSGNWKDQTVRVLGKSWDEGGGIWWVLVDFKYNDQAQYRVWTGIKRVDIDPAYLTDIRPLCSGTVHFTSDTYRGPGGRYARANINISEDTSVWVYSRENGYTEIEYDQNGQKHRVWVPESLVYIPE